MGISLCSTRIVLLGPNSNPTLLRPQRSPICGSFRTYFSRPCNFLRSVILPPPLHQLPLHLSPPLPGLSLDHKPRPLDLSYLVKLLDLFPVLISPPTLSRTIWSMRPRISSLLVQSDTTVVVVAGINRLGWNRSRRFTTFIS